MPEITHTTTSTSDVWHNISTHTSTSQGSQDNLIRADKTASPNRSQEKSPDNITISTQNCGGMRGEYHRRYGPKTSVLRKLLANRRTDFLVLTETRAEDTKKQNIRLKWGLQASISSLCPEAKAGVIVYATDEHKLIEDSVKYGSAPGHLCMAVYEKNKKKLIVIGYYGPSENNDKLSVKLLQELRDNIKTLQHVYNTNRILIAGDFNAVWRERDANSYHSRKPQTTRLFQEIIEEFQLTDLGLLQGARHTWYRRGQEQQSSRIDYILTNLQVDGAGAMKPQVNTIFTIFDHVYLQATFGAEMTKRKSPMKDYILGSEEYIISAEENIKQIIRQYGITKPEYQEEAVQRNGDGTTASFESQFTFNHDSDGINSLMVLNTIISRLEYLHNNILKTSKMQAAQKLQNTSKTIFRLKTQLKRAREQS